MGTTVKFYKKTYRVGEIIDRYCEVYDYGVGREYSYTQKIRVDSIDTSGTIWGHDIISGGFECVAAPDDHCGLMPDAIKGE